MSMQIVKLCDLKPPTANPRHVICQQTLEGLAESICHDGLLQNLVVSPIKGKNKGRVFRIISGERRFRALQLLAEKGDIDDEFQIPVEVRSHLSKDDVLRLATIENLQRENLPPLDEAKALAALIKNGEKLDEIASKTGLSVSTIKRRVVLNTLCESAQKALSDGAITLAQAEALTLGDEKAQQAILDDLARYGAMDADEIRDHLLDDRPTVAMAVFPVEDYTGTITTDLFAEGESSYFDDAEQFLELQKQAIASLAADYESKADWVEITNCYNIPDWQYEPANEDEQGGVLINLSPSGRVEIRAGLLRPEIDEQTRDQTAQHPAKHKAAYSAPVRRYIAWHKSIAVQEVLLADPRKAKEVAAVLKLQSFRPHGALIGLSKQELPGKPYAVLEEQARLFADKLGFEFDADEPLLEQFPPCFTEAEELYAAIKSLTDHELDQLTSLLTAFSFGQLHCDSLDVDASLFNQVATDLQIDMRNHWQPDGEFFSRRTRDQLIEIAKECGYADGVGTIGSFKKGELVTALVKHFSNAFAAAEPSAAQQKARDWLPGVMAFPAINPDAA